MSRQTYGERSRIAIEVGLDAPKGFCGILLWIGGRPIGDIDAYEPAGGIREAFEAFCLGVMERQSESMFAMDAKACLDQVYEGSFGRAASLEEAVSKGRIWRPFLLSPNFCESLDDFLIVVVAYGPTQRVIARRLKSPEIFEVVCESGVLESTMMAARDFLASLELTNDPKREG